MNKAAVLGVLLVVAGMIALVVPRLFHPYAGPSELQGAPVALKVDGAPRVLLVMRHEEGTYSSGSQRRRTLYVHELWCFDAVTARPLWKKRLAVPTKGMPATPIGTDNGVLWLYADGPMGVSTRDGSMVADAAAIEAKNPDLRGLMPREEQYFKFDRGLLLTAADAHVYRVDAGSLKVKAFDAADPGSPWDDDTQPNAYWTPSATYAFMTGAAQHEHTWLGLMTPATFAQYQKAPALPTDRTSVNERVKLYAARIDEVSATPESWPKDFPNPWGTKLVIKDLALLPDSREYLDGGLLRGGSVTSKALAVTNPDGLLVLHRDRLGEDGKLQLARVDLAGKQLWSVALPLSIIQSIMRFDQDRLLFYGRAYTPNPDHRVRDPYHTAHEWLLRVDLRDGSVQGCDVGIEPHAAS